MLEQLKYKNHENEVFEFGRDGVFVNIGSVHDYSWTVNKKNNRISSITYGVQTRKLPVVIICGTDEEGIAARNRLMEVFEKDVLAFQYGKIIIGDYYFRCFVTKSEKKNYLSSDKYMTLNLTLTTDLPYWVKETSTIFQPASSSSGTTGLDYGFEYPFDYGNAMDSKALVNTGFMPSNFRLIVNGPCSNPAVYVAGHLYKVNCDILSGQYLTIDSANKAVTLTANDGTVTNVFSSRDKDSYIFEKIPSGSSPVTWSGDFTFEIVLLEERSEPKWT